MHLYQNSSIDPGAVSAYLNHTEAGTPFAVVVLDSGARIHLRTAGEADALIAAAVEAKRLLDPPVITCPAHRDFPREGDVRCVRTPGHPGLHGAGDLTWAGDVGAEPVITDSEPAQTYGLCPSDSPLGNYGCTLEPGHGGMHQSVEPLTGKARAEWTATS